MRITATILGFVIPLFIGTQAHADHLLHKAQDTATEVPQDRSEEWLVPDAETPYIGDFMPPMKLVERYFNCLKTNQTYAECDHLVLRHQQTAEAMMLTFASREGGENIAMNILRALKQSTRYRSDREIWDRIAGSTWQLDDSSIRVTLDTNGDGEIVTAGQTAQPFEWTVRNKRLVFSPDFDANDNSSDRVLAISPSRFISVNVGTGDVQVMRKIDR